MGYTPWGHKESETTKRRTLSFLFLQPVFRESHAHVECASVMQWREERERAQNWVPGVDEHQFPARFSAWLKDDSWEQLLRLDADPHPGSQVAFSLRPSSWSTDPK